VCDIVRAGSGIKQEQESQQQLQNKTAKKMSTKRLSKLSAGCTRQQLRNSTARTKHEQRTYYQRAANAQLKQDT
jgi:hypothetical protein